MNAKQTAVTEVFTFHTDPGHAWLEVSKRGLEAVGLHPWDFTPYSYRRGDWCYLEEDCDAPKFLRAMESAGRSFRIEEKHTDAEHWIRELCPIK